jgi:hypothetical protein
MAASSSGEGFHLYSRSNSLFGEFIADAFAGIFKKSFLWISPEQPMVALQWHAL